MSESSWALSASTSFSPFWSEPTMMVRRSSRPSRAQLRTIAAQEQALGDQRGQADKEECREPEPRYFAAELGEERRADEQQEHEGPGRDHPRHLAELAAEHLHFVDIGGLEADHRGRGHAEDGGDIFPVKAGKARHISEIERDADEAQQHEIGDAYGAGDHDRRIGPAYFLVGDGKGGLRQPAAPFDRGAIAVRCRVAAAAAALSMERALIGSTVTQVRSCADM